MVSAEVTLREGGRVILQDCDAISPVLPVKMIPEPVTSMRGNHAEGKGAGETSRAFWEYDVIYMGVGVPSD